MVKEVKSTFASWR